MTTRNQAAKSLYPNQPDTAPAASATRSTAVQAPIFSGAGEGSSISGVLSAYYDPYEARLRNDASALEQARAERRAVEEWAHKRKIRPDDLHQPLSALKDRAIIIAHRRQKLGPHVTDGPHAPDAPGWAATMRTLTHEEGSREGALRLWERTVKGVEIAKAELPASVVQRVGGAMTDPRIMRFLASLAPEK